jgi:hypothetical protein
LFQGQDQLLEGREDYRTFVLWDVLQDPTAYGCLLFDDSPPDILSPLCELDDVVSPVVVVLVLDDISFFAERLIKAADPSLGKVLPFHQCSGAELPSWIHGRKQCCLCGGNIELTADGELGH